MLRLESFYLERQRELQIAIQKKADEKRKRKEQQKFEKTVRLFNKICGLAIAQDGFGLVALQQELVERKGVHESTLDPRLNFTDIRLMSISPLTKLAIDGEHSAVTLLEAVIDNPKHTSWMIIRGYAYKGNTEKVDEQLKAHPFRSNMDIAAESYASGEHFKQVEDIVKRGGGGLITSVRAGYKRLGYPHDAAANLYILTETRSKELRISLSEYEKDDIWCSTLPLCGRNDLLDEAENLNKIMEKHALNYSQAHILRFSSMGLRTFCLLGKQKLPFDILALVLCQYFDLKISQQEARMLLKVFSKICYDSSKAVIDKQIKPSAVIGFFSSERVRVYNSKLNDLNKRYDDKGQRVGL